MAPLALAVGSACAYRPASDPNTTLSFGAPERVRIVGYDDDAMEPFLSRDGKYLLFNNLNEPSVNTDLHFAERVDDVTFQYRGRLDGANTVALEGVPTMDRAGTIYFVSPRSYAQSRSTIYRGSFDAGRVTTVELVPGISRNQLGRVNFDVDVSPDGNTLYFVDGLFGNGGPPKEAKLVIAERVGQQFRRKANSDALLRNVNTSLLQYAACISADGLSLYFNRTRVGLFGGTAIFLATRPDTSSPFGVPKRIAAITGFVEGATLSPDERSVYYHKKDGTRFVLYRVVKH
ncbi:MAG: hypothetical protein V4550_00740 [Gemmatimonadota bacterium]